MKILIVSGFLGAGKTTFIQAMTDITGRDFAVYENEYAGAGIDTKRLEENPELSVWESTENCVCCSGKADFAEAVLTISNSIDPEYLIVEPTGVAKLSNILENIRKIQYERITLLKPVSIIDFTNYYNGKVLYPDISEDQVRTASVIVFSKTENALPEELEALQKDIRKLNPDAEFVTGPYEDLGKDWFMRVLENRLDQEPVNDTPSGSPSSPETSAGQAGNDPGAPETSLPESITLVSASLPSPTHLIGLLDMIVFGQFGDIVRAKGSIPCGKEWIRFDLVGGSWIMTGDEPCEKAECVFIGKNISGKEIRSILRENMIRL